jgi:hypothetical protein
MAKKSVTQITVTTTGDGITNTNAPNPLTNAAASPGSGPFEKLLVAGNNSILPPATAIGVVVCSIAASGVLPILKGANADVGIAIGDGFPAHLPFAATPAPAIVINSVLGGIVYLQWV